MASDLETLLRVKLAGKRVALHFHCVVSFLCSDSALTATLSATVLRSQRARTLKLTLPVACAC